MWKLLVLVAALPSDEDDLLAAAAQTVWIGEAGEDDPTLEEVECADEEEPEPEPAPVQAILPPLIPLLSPEALVFWKMLRDGKIPPELNVIRDKFIFVREAEGIRPIVYTEANIGGGRWEMWTAIDHDHVNLVAKKLGDEGRLIRGSRALGPPRPPAVRPWRPAALGAVSGYLLARDAYNGVMPVGEWKPWPVIIPIVDPALDAIGRIGPISNFQQAQDALFLQMDRNGRLPPTFVLPLNAPPAQNLLRGTPWLTSHRDGMDAMRVLWHMQGKKMLEMEPIGARR